MFERLAGTRFVGDADSSVPPALRRGAEDESANVVVKKPRLLQVRGSHAHPLAAATARSVHGCSVARVPCYGIVWC